MLVQRTHDSRRNPAHHAVHRNISCHNCTGAHDGVRSHNYAGQNDRLMTNEHVVLYLYSSDVIQVQTKGAIDHIDTPVMPKECAPGHSDVVSQGDVLRVRDSDVRLDG